MSDPSTGPDEVLAEPTPEATPEATTEATPELAPESAPEPTGRRGPSVPTVVWGLIFALIAAGVIAAQTSDVDLNLDVTAPTALLVAGVVLVLWGIAGLGRSRLRR